MAPSLKKPSLKHVVGAGKHWLQATADVGKDATHLKTHRLGQPHADDVGRPKICALASLSCYQAI